MIAKIAFLFLTIDGIYHEAYWNDFFKGYEDFCSIYIHSKNKMSSKSPFKKYLLPVKVRTTWYNTMNAQIELLRYALQDPANQKFIFLSETTIPLTDFRHVYITANTTMNSIFTFKPNPHPSRKCAPINKKYHYKNPQWVILNRKHAQMMVEDTTYLPILTTYPFDNEHYPSTFLAIHNLLSEVVQHDTTYVRRDNYYAKHPFLFTNMNQPNLNVMQSAIEKKYLFARKIAKDCDLKPLDPYLSYRIMDMYV